MLGGCLPGKSEQVDVPAKFTERGDIPTFDISSNSTTITIGMIGDIFLHHPLYTYENYDFAFER